MIRYHSPKSGNDRTLTLTRFRLEVGGAIQSSWPDVINTHYQNTIKQGDQLLNSIQKLARVHVTNV